MTAITLHEGDNRDHLRRLIAEGVRVHSVVTDPPYGLVSVTKRFGAQGAAPAKFGTDGAFKRASAGFMGSQWDGTGIERDPEFWRLIHDILLPGGYVVAFASSRTFHRMAVAIEDAGFITHPMLGWVFGSGFPKAHNAAMAIDKHLKVEGGRGDEGWQRDWMQDADKVDASARRYEPGSRDAEPWDGWAYGAQALKPALEPIYVGQRPFDGKTGAPSILKHGVGAINIDGCRVPPTGERLGGGGEKSDTAGKFTNDGWRRPWMDDPAASTAFAMKVAANVERATALGRYPANLLHDGSDDVVALFPHSTSGAMKAGTKRAAQDEAGSVCYGVYGGNTTSKEIVANSGSAARFFNAFPADEPYPVFYHPKAGKADRAGSKHPTVKPIALMRWLCRLITPPGGTVLDPFAGSGTTGAAARLEGFSSLLMEGEPAFAADIRRRFDLAGPQFHLSSEFDALLGAEEAADLQDILG